MTDQDRKAARREIADALLKALERRHEIADVVVESENKAAAVEAIVRLLDTSHAAAEAVMGMSFDMLTIDSRRKILAELEDLNKQLSFTLGERPASSGETLELRPFSAAEDRDIFAARTEEIKTAGDGSGGPAGVLEDEISAALRRVDDEEAAWFVAIDSGLKGRDGLRRAAPAARSTCGSGFTPSTARRVTAPPRCASRAPRWRGASPRCRWSSARRPPPIRASSAVARDGDDVAELRHLVALVREFQAVVAEQVASRPAAHLPAPLASGSRRRCCARRRRRVPTGRCRSRSWPTGH